MEKRETVTVLIDGTSTCTHPSNQWARIFICYFSCPLFLWIFDLSDSPFFFGCWDVCHSYHDTHSVFTHTPTCILILIFSFATPSMLCANNKWCIVSTKINRKSVNKQLTVPYIICRSIFWYRKAIHTNCTDCQQTHLECHNQTGRKKKNVDRKTANTSTKCMGIFHLCEIQQISLD